MNVRGEVHAYLPPEHYRRLKLEAAARQVSLSLCVAQCLGEYFTLREEMGTALKTPTQPGALSRRVIQVLLAETEQRLVATFERYVDDLVALRGSVDALLAMADHAAFLTLGQTLEVPLGARGRIPASGPRRFAALAPGRDPHAPGLGTARAVAPGRSRGRLRSRTPGGRPGCYNSDDPGTSPQPLGSAGRPMEQDDPRRPRSTAPLGRPTHEGLPRTPDSSDPPSDLAPDDAGLRARLAGLMGWDRTSAPPRPR